MESLSSASSCCVLHIFNGGRFVAVLVARALLICDLGHPRSLIDGVLPKIVGRWDAPGLVITWKFTAISTSNWMLVCGDFSRYKITLAIEYHPIWTHKRVLSLHCIRCEFQEVEQKVLLHEYPVVNLPQRSEAYTMFDGRFLLAVTAFRIIRHDLATNTQVEYDVPDFWDSEVMYSIFISREKYGIVSDGI